MPKSNDITARLIDLFERTDSGNIYQRNQDLSGKDYLQKLNQKLDIDCTWEEFNKKDFDQIEIYNFLRGHQTTILKIKKFRRKSFREEEKDDLNIGDIIVMNNLANVYNWTREKSCGEVISERISLYGGPPYRGEDGYKVRFFYQTGKNSKNSVDIWDVRRHFMEKRVFVTEESPLVFPDFKIIFSPGRKTELVLGWEPPYEDRFDIGELDSKVKENKKLEQIPQSIEEFFRLAENIQNFQITKHD